MPWLWWVLAGWFLASTLAALLIGRGVRIADRCRSIGRGTAPVTASRRSPS